MEKIELIMPNPSGEVKIVLEVEVERSIESRTILMEEVKRYAEKHKEELKFLFPNKSDK